MNLALIAAVASMVVAIISAIILAVRQQETHDRKRRLCITGVVVGGIAFLLNCCLNPEITRPTLTWVVYVLTVAGIAITTMSTSDQWKRPYRQRNLIR
jgi:hypothetical protein